MKNLVKMFATIVIVIAGTWLFPQQIWAQDDYDINDPVQNNATAQNNVAPLNDGTAQNGPISLQVFYDELSPYGTWIKDPNYGFVWSPNVDQNFKPYVTNGHWVNTDYGWTWVSDFSWGWAPFHYGKWTVDPQYGNIWIPDTVWGPAWVSWRQSDGYVGWTPMGPGVDVNYALGSSYNVPYDRWNFVSYNDFMQDDLYSYCLGRSLIYNIFNTSMLIRGTYFDNYRHSTYFYGPSRGDYQRYAHRIINPVHIRDYNRPGQSYSRGYLSIYRPQVQRSNAYGRMPAPGNMNRNIAGRNVPNNYRDNSSYNRSANIQGRNSQTVQQSRAYPTNNQRIQQPARYTNSGYQGRGVQTAQQPGPNSYRSQGVTQNSRNTYSNYQARSSQPVNQQVYQGQGRSNQSASPASNYRQQQSRVSSYQPSQRAQSSYQPSQRAQSLYQPSQRAQSSSNSRQGNYIASANNSRGSRGGSNRR